MTPAIFDLDDVASEEPFLDWLCYYLYAHYESVRQLVDGNRLPAVSVYLWPGSPFDPGRTRLLVNVEDYIIVVQDEWAAAAGADHRRVVRDIFRVFGFSTEERALAEQKALADEFS
jgi:hypothetical protein